MVDVILLSGGESTRFWPFRKKNVMSFLGKPLLYWHYEQLVRIGAKNVIVVVNKESQKDIEAVLIPKKLSVTFALQEGKGQGQAVFSAGSLLGEKPALIINASDIYEDELLKEITELYKKDPEFMYIAAVQVKSYFPGGYLKLKEDQTIGEIIEKPKEDKVPSDLVKMVVDVIPNMKTFSHLLKTYRSRPVDGYERALNKLMIDQTIAKSLITATQWVYLKYPWHMLTVMNACLHTMNGQIIDPSVKIGKYVTIEGPVIIEEGAKISESTKIVGPTFIGKGTIVGNNNIVRKSHIGANCVTGFNTDITRSYIGNNCWFHTNYVGDSIVGNNVSMGSGTVLANLRLDESAITTKVKEEVIQTGRTKLGAMVGDNVRIGVNASIMPGVKIGEGSFVGAGVVLGEDLADGMYCRLSSTVVISQNARKPSSSREQFRNKL